MSRLTSFIALKCSNCGKKFKRIEWQHTQHIRRNLKKDYCSSKCKDSRCMEDHPRWSGGRHHYKAGYIMINLGNGKRMWEHRLVMEKKLGRKIKEGEAIHHINGIRSDNRIENLVLCKTHGEHTSKFHPQKKKTHCKRGHELTDGNIYWGGHRQRNCKKCNLLLQKKRRQIKAGLFNG